MKFARHLLEYFAARCALAILSFLPRPVARRLAASGSRAVFGSLPRLHRIGLRNLELAFPDLSLEERQKILTQSLDNFGRIAADFAPFAGITKDELSRLVHFDFPPEAEARYREAKAAGRGVIFVTPHLGNWEVLALAASALLEPITYLARPLDNPLLDRYTSRLRRRFGNRPIDKRASMIEGLSILDGGGNIGILADVNTLQRDGVFVPFFGHLACTTRAVAMFALRTNALIVPICAVWEGQRYRVIVGQLSEAVRSAGYAKKNIIDTTALYTAEVEKFIRAYPGQWIWVHRRWKTRPSGEKSLYD